ncbi:hypothetical protein EKO27_g4898 [Xylaria grammica]|uniref:Oxo-4-hydroxy-4-carboxy-5-ureidoimidazoline decarboxylase domain-containing protein n=1 Tax=Xylaria grammica TaxID=363999 RepID=A0A439D710_9PEZI|nr:hypothetical protein EKO27_g4898 [Xylaria grammica]
MATPGLPPVSSLPQADEKTLEFVLDALFEPSAEIHSIAIPAIQSSASSSSLSPPTIPNNPPFTSYASLIQHIGTLLRQLTVLSSSSSSPFPPPEREKLHGILGSHPRLGAKKVDSAQSRAEQAQLNTGASDEAERLAVLNREYEERFPGLRYVVFVNGRSRDVIMEDMRRRIDRGDIRAEEKEGIQV